MSEESAKKRLMNAAMEFVRQGQTPTTRELAAQAEVNISAISYYFQGKENLIAEALDQAAREDIERDARVRRRIVVALLHDVGEGPTGEVAREPGFDR